MYARIGLTAPAFRDFIRSPSGWNGSDSNQV
jgi:hypothetical protein